MQLRFWHNPISRRLKISLFVFLAIATISLATIARPVSYLSYIAWSDRNDILPLPPGTVDDASRLNATPMDVRYVPGDLKDAEEMLKAVLREAKAEGKRVAIAGSRHTMGGQTLYVNGIALDMTHFDQMQLNPTAQTLNVQSGATWATVISYLNQQGYSVAVMQTNSDFSVGGTMGANAHGWQHNSPPFASTVESFRLMLADGKVVNCSRQENPELFSLVLGGYGLFGIVLDVNLRVVPNETYVAERVIIPSDQYIETYRDRVDGSDDIGMAYGRLSIAPENFLKEAILTTYRRSSEDLQAIPPLEDPGKGGLVRTVFLGSVGSDYGKNLRWQMEKLLGGETNALVSRNQLLSRPVALFENHRQAETDILHEYFIPPRSLEAFLEKCRTIIPKYQGNLLNVTIRNVHTDKDAYLRYADQEMFGLVMLFHQQRTPEADAQMQAMTQELIDAAFSVDGTYYLPYRLHATPEQFHRAYPQAAQFFALKQKYDPDEIFQNYFYLKYKK